MTADCINESGEYVLLNSSVNNIFLFFTSCDGVEPNATEAAKWCVVPASDDDC
jgi:hypothetical protein